MFVLTLMLAGLSTAHARDPSLAAQVGTAGVSRADPSALTNVLEGSAAIALQSRYDMAVGGRLGPNGEKSVQVGAADSATSPFTMGLFYSREVNDRSAREEDLRGWRAPDDDSAEHRRMNTVGVGLAKPLLDRALSLGLGGTYQTTNTDADGYVGYFNMNASVGTRLAQRLVVVASGQNLLPTRFYDTPMTVGGGARFLAGGAGGVGVDVEADLDAEGDTVPLVVGAAGDYVFAESVPARVGFSRDLGSGEDSLGVGIGFANATASFDYGVRFLVGQGDDSGGWGWHALSLRISL